MRRTEVVVNPKDFTAAEWRELYYAEPETHCPRITTSEQRNSSAIVQVPVGRVETLAKMCRQKAKAVRAGQYGLQEKTSQLERWVEELEGAAAVLAGYAERATVAQAKPKV